jgi:23S rRNA C2498 (ribose-2'-O)-methylase RlmM
VVGETGVDNWKGGKKRVEPLMIVWLENMWCCELVCNLMTKYINSHVKVNGSVIAA